MSGRTKTILAFLFLTGAPVASFAQSSGDMFADKTGIIPNGAGSMTHTDMFGPSLYTMSQRDDVFPHPPVVMGPNVDMYGHPLPQAYNLDMFHSTVSNIPDEPLYDWPPGQPYP